MIINNPELHAKILSRHKTIAVVGLSRDPGKDSHKVSEYMKNAGYHLIPVNPSADEILGEKVYKDLLDVPGEVDVVNIFRPSEEVGPIVDKAIKKGAKVIWMQLGIFDREAAEKAAQAGLDVIMDWCIMTEHMRLLGGRS